MPKGKLTPQQAVILNKAEEEMPSMSDVARVDVIELKKSTDNLERSLDNLIEQLEGESSEDLPMRELLGLDKELRSIRDSLKVEVAKRFSWQKKSIEKSVSLRKSLISCTTQMCNEKKSRSASPS